MFLEQFICGVGGVGKTKLALQYAASQEKAYQRGVVCVDAQSLMTIEASLQEYVRPVARKQNAEMIWCLLL